MSERIGLDLWKSTHYTTLKTGWEKMRFFFLNFHTRSCWVGIINQHRLDSGVRFHTNFMNKKLKIKSFEPKNRIIFTFTMLEETYFTQNGKSYIYENDRHTQKQFNGFKLENVELCNSTNNWWYETNYKQVESESFYNSSQTLKVWNAIALKQK